MRNLTALYTVDPRLARRIDALPFASLPGLEATRDGRKTVKLRTDDGRPVYAHSAYAPLEEARTLLRNQMRRREPGAGQPAQDGAGPTAGTHAQAGSEADAEEHAGDGEYACFFLSGFGLGYVVAEIERSFPRPLVVVAEDDVALLKAALCVHDVSDALRERRLAFLSAPDKADLHERLRPIITPLMLGLHVISLPYTRRCHAEFHQKMATLLRDFVAFARLQMVSVVRNARITCRNSALNLPAYLAQPGVEVLAGRAAGYPAIIVAAGPSLARNIEQLAELRSRAVIIAVQTVLKTLLARGVRPHFVTSLDYHEVSAQFFRGLEECRDLVLVAEPKVSWRVLDAFRGRTHVLHSGFLTDLLGAAAPARGALKAGSTVAHLSFYLAEHLRCDPILLVGQDLSFSDGLYYPAGMQVERIWGPELGRFTTVEMKQWERVVRHRAGLRKVKDIHGADVYTDDQMYTYAEQFQSDFLACSAHVIQATEGGMRLEGTEVLTLREAAARHCTREIPADLFALPEQPPARAALMRACTELEQRLSEVREIRAISEETMVVLAQLADFVTQPAEFNRRVARVDDLHARVQRHEQTYNLISSVAQHAELRRVQADRAILEGQPETPERARRRLRRDREYVAAFVEGCDYLAELIAEALANLRKHLPGAEAGAPG